MLPGQVWGCCLRLLLTTWELPVAYAQPFFLKLWLV